MSLIGIITLFMMAFALTGGLKQIYLKSAFLDIPNHRSAHATPVPRAGGVAFIVSFLGILLLYWFEHKASPVFTLIACLGGGSIAVIGFMDDCHSLSISKRLMVHALVCAISLLFLFPYSSFLYSLFLFFYWIWLLNLYNFMDGIDGLASAEAISACLGAALIYYLLGEYHLIDIPLLLTASVGGFLCFNWPPAKLFMGDVGSGFLGFILGLLSFEAANINPCFFYMWLILLGVFIVDASTTLVIRAALMKRFWEGHSEHAYQHAARQYSHRKVTVATIGLNVLWLWPQAYGAAKGYTPGVYAVAIAYIPLVFIAIYYKSGRSVPSRACK